MHPPPGGWATIGKMVNQFYFMMKGDFVIYISVNAICFLLMYRIL